MNSQELQEILEAHKEYVKTDGESGTCAYLRGAYLEGVNLGGVHYVLQWQAPQGEKRICYSVKHDNYVIHKLGCFWGTTDEAVNAIRKKYGKGSMYVKVLLINTEALENENTM